LSEYVQQANKETLVVIHLETAAAVAQLPEMVKIDGLDVIFIGQTDLAQSLGFARPAAAPLRVQEAVQERSSIRLQNRTSPSASGGYAAVAGNGRSAAPVTS